MRFGFGAQKRIMVRDIGSGILTIKIAFKTLDWNISGPEKTNMATYRKIVE